MRDYYPQAAALYDEMVEQRRDFHQHPEIAFEEIRTSRIIAETLSKLGLEVQTGIGKTGVVGILEGVQEGPTILVRCDMDALPIEEQSDVPYCSQIPQRMHACGHDGHMTIALAVAKLLQADRHQMKGRVKFVFQPAEEIGKGARAMFADGVLDNPKPEKSFGLHLWSEVPAGTVVIHDTAFMAGVSNFTITLTGKGGHAAQPHLTIDPVLTAAQVVMGLQSIVSRNLNPFDTGVLSVTQILAGDVFNVIPNQAIIKGTCRTYDPATTQLIHQRMETLLHGMAQAMGCTAEIDFQELLPPVINDREIAHHLRQTLPATLPDIHFKDEFRLMVSEDMSLFLEEAPGVFFLVGSGSHGKDFPHHHPQFDLDESALVVGAAVLASAVSEYVF